MKWSEFKKQVDDALHESGVGDMSIPYCNINGHSAINVTVGPLGLVITGSLSTKPLNTKPTDLQQ